MLFKIALSAFGIFALFACGVGPASAKSERIELEPSSQWHLDYADDSCRLARRFGEGENQIAFYIERYEPGDNFFMVVAGHPLGRERGLQIDLSFGPDGFTKKRLSMSGNLGDFGPAIMANNLMLLELGGDKEKEKSGFDPAELTAETEIFGQELTPEQEAGILWLDVDPRGKKPLRLALGAMDKPMEAMRRCTDELLTHWGLDLELLRGMIRAPVPVTNPGNWLRPKDYPKGSVWSGEQAVVQVRLIVGEDGMPTSCHIQQATNSKGFRKAVCDGLLRRAKFHPALGANGQPIPSYWQETVFFTLP